MDDLYRPFVDLVHARFLDRPNRFLVRCECDGEELDAFLPNPGRLRELLLPGRALYLAREEKAGRRTSYTVVAVEREGLPVMLHTHLTNTALGRLLEERLVPGFEETTIAKREVTVGKSRFDFLLKDREGEIFLEIKSCTLFGERVAMFPDAVTARGARHLHELARLAEGGRRCAVIFAIQWPRSDVFMPDYHTDLYFTRTLLDVRHSVSIVPIALRWLPDLSLSEKVKTLQVPWQYVEREAVDRGSYILVLHLQEDRRIVIGAAGEMLFPKGFYLYVGSAMTNLTARLTRHLRLRKRTHWHIDWLRPHTTVRAVLPIRASARLECEIARRLSVESDWSMPGFGCSDCSCSSHLFATREDPMLCPAFHRLLQYFRMDRFP
jgi:sugar fermentation stimulation protein A